MLECMASAPRIAWGRLLRFVFYALFAVALFGFVSRAFILTRSAAPPEHQPFVYEFKDDGILHETDTPEHSSSPYWWVDSGGKLMVENGVGKTLYGELPASDPWRPRYARTSPTDTDRGTHPQNLFRMLTKDAWDNVRIESSFRITADNFSNSPNRDESNGILLMSRYRDENNLYYAGLRVDGHAVIKKKHNGSYVTLAEKPILSGAYARAAQVNLLPHREWITLRMDTKTEDGKVTITLFQKGESGEWQELLKATDSTNPLTGSHPIGLRTDFMDVEFDNYRAEKI